MRRFAGLAASGGLPSFQSSSGAFRLLCPLEPFPFLPPPAESVLEDEGPDWCEQNAHAACFRSLGGQIKEVQQKGTVPLTLKSTYTPTLLIIDPETWSKPIYQ